MTDMNGRHIVSRDEIGMLAHDLCQLFQVLREKGFPVASNNQGSFLGKAVMKLYKGELSHRRAIAWVANEAGGMPMAQATKLTIAAVTQLHTAEEAGVLAFDMLADYKVLKRAGLPIPKDDQCRLLGEAMLLYQSGGDLPVHIIDWIVAQSGLERRTDPTPRPKEGCEECKIDTRHSRRHKAQAAGA